MLNTQEADQTIHGLKLDSPEQIMDELAYRCYRHNRQLAPQYPPKTYECIWSPLVVARMEQRYQMEVRS